MSAAAMYVTLQAVKAYGLPKAKNDDADDGVISMLIESASLECDHITGRTFYPTAAVLPFDTPLANTIMFDDDLQSLTSITNGDGVVLDPSKYILLPYSGPPYYAVKLRPTAGVAWNTNAGDPLGAIQISGTWGVYANAPADIQEAILMIVKNAYNRRYGDNQSGKSIVTAGGVIVTPEDIPDKAMDTFLNHRRVSFG